MKAMSLKTASHQKIQKQTYIFKFPGNFACWNLIKQKNSKLKTNPSTPRNLCLASADISAE